MKYPYRVIAAHRSTGASRDNATVSTSLQQARNDLEKDGFLISKLEPILNNDEQAIAAAEYARMRHAIFWGVTTASIAIGVVSFFLLLILAAVAGFEI